MSVTKNNFNKITRALWLSQRQEQAERVAREIGTILMREVIDRQPLGKLDSWDQATTSSQRQGHTPISLGWGNSPFIEPNEDNSGAILTLRNISEHVKYFVWSVGGEVRSHLGTEGHRIPLAGLATEAYGHPLAFYWLKRDMPWITEAVEHPGMPRLRSEERSFVDEAWFSIYEKASEIVRDAGMELVLHSMREMAGE